MAQRPMYQQIAEDLRAQIESGELEPGAQLPTELELRDRYASSRNTIRDAIKRLTSQGLVETRPGQGTFVTRRVDPFVTVLTGDPTSGRGEGAAYLSEVSESHRARASASPRVEIQVPSAEVSRRLRVAPDTQVVSRHEKRYIDGIPWSLQTSFYPMDFITKGATPPADGRAHRRRRRPLPALRPSASGRSATGTGSRRAFLTPTSSRSSDWHTMPRFSRCSAPASTRPGRRCA